LKYLLIKILRCRLRTQDPYHQIKGYSASSPAIWLRCGCSWIFQ